MLNLEDTRIFEDARPNLLGLAYRILGSLADAEDAVQDTFLKWAQTDRYEVENAGVWLMTTCTRRCLDMRRSAHRTRVSYVGAWLPEPIQTPIESEAENKLDVVASLTTAFLLMLERLTPKERAAYLLREIFEVSYQDIADTLDMPENTCRKLVSRAKANIEHDKVRHTTPLEQQDQLLSAFKVAVTEGATEQLARLLSKGIRLSADGGGKVPTILNILRGKDHVLAFLFKGLKKYWAGHQWINVDINGARGFAIKHNGATVAAVSFAYDESGMATDIFVVRNPDKLSNLDAVAIH